MDARLLWWNGINGDTRVSGVASAKLEWRLVRSSCYVICESLDKAHEKQDGGDKRDTASGRSGKKPA